eukprot:jgi/Ulvmu1/4819/UM020_0104.1
MGACPMLATETVKRVNEELHNRYSRNASRAHTSALDKLEHEKAVVLHRLDATLADVQSKIAWVNAKQVHEPLDKALHIDNLPNTQKQHAAPPPQKLKTSALRDALEEKLNAYRYDLGSLEALRDRVLAAQQEEHLQKLLNQPDLNYVALNIAAADDPHAFIQTSESGHIQSMDSETILTTALSRIPGPLLHASTLPEIDSNNDVLQQQPAAEAPPQEAPTQAAVTPHLSYNVAKLLEQRDRSVAPRKSRFDVIARTYASPGCGGSPTALPAFQAAVAKRAMKQAQHMQQVRSKHNELLDRELDKRRAAFTRSARRSAAAAQAKEQAALLPSMHERARPWMTIVELCWRLAVIQDAILLARDQRKAQRRCEHAATIIQRAWRSYDMMRRNRAMVHIVRQARHHLEPRVPRIRLRCRQRVASRIIEYMRSTQRVGHTQATIMRVLQQMRLIQKTWRNLHAIRREQVGLLLAQLVAFESRAIAANHRRHREKAPSSTPRRTLPSESSKGTVTSDTPADALHAPLRNPLRGDSWSLAEMSSADWTPKLSAITQRVGNQYKLKAVKEALQRWRAAYMGKIATWQASMKLYVESARLDQMRVRLLQEAGIPNVQCQVLRPLRPCMRVVATHAELKQMLLRSHCLVLEHARQKAVEQREREDEELRQFLQRRQDLAAR